MTGFPGVSRICLLPKLLARRDGVVAVCLVQPQHLEAAESRLAEIEKAHPHTVDRIQLITGDITATGLGVDPDEAGRLDDVTEVWHLAAVYDLTVPEAVAQRVNVDGTARILDFCWSRRI